MDNLYLRYLDLPCTIKGLTIQDEEGNYNIYLNSRLTYEANLKTLQHEINHINNNDFTNPIHVSKMEKSY